MKNILNRILVVGVIFIFLGVSFVPSLNAVSIPKKSKYNSVEGGFFFSIVILRGEGTWTESAPHGLIVFDCNNVYIQSLFRAWLDYYSGVHLIPYDKYISKNLTEGLIIGFRGIKSHSPFFIIGFTFITELS